MGDKEKIFAKIPVNIFHNEGEVYKKIGGRNSFIIYALLTSRKTMADEVYISIKDIASIVKFDKNTSRSKKAIIKSLEQLRSESYIDFDFDINCKRIDETFILKWILQFKKGESGWTKFFAQDFKTFSKIGSLSYTTMWLLRMYKHYEKGYSYISMNDMASILETSKTKIQNITDLFKVSRLFLVERGDYYYNREQKKNLKLNNEYTYTANSEGLMKMTESEIFLILYNDMILREKEKREDKHI